MEEEEEEQVEGQCGSLLRILSKFLKLIFSMLILCESTVLCFCIFEFFGFLKCYSFLVYFCRGVTNAALPVFIFSNFLHRRPMKGLESAFLCLWCFWFWFD